jgi:RNA polymerase sigma-70 factor (ECF subfamily)
MAPEDSFASLMARLQAGDDRAAAEVFHRFAQRLIALARLHLDSRLRQKVDPEDVLQSVYRSFFVRQAEGRLSLQNWESLWSLLTVITVRKCGRWSERFHTGRRDLNAEVAGRTAEADSLPALDFPSPEPDPAEVVMLTELVEQLLRELGQRDGEIVSLALQGYSADEISARLERPRRTVYRVLERIRGRLQRRQEEALQAP